MPEHLAADGNAYSAVVTTGTSVPEADLSAEKDAQHQALINQVNVAESFLQSAALVLEEAKQSNDEEALAIANNKFTIKEQKLANAKAALAEFESTLEENN